METNTHKSQLFPFALITQKSKGVDRRVEEKTPKTLRIKIENQKKKKKIEDVSWWGKFLSFFSFFPSVTLWIFNDKTSRHHFLPLVPSYLVAPTFSLLTDQFGYSTQHLCPIPPFLLSWLSSSQQKEKKLCVLNCASSSSIFLILGSCCMEALRDAFRGGIFIFFTLVHGSRKRLGSTQLVAQLL